MSVSKITVHFDAEVVRFELEGAGGRGTVYYVPASPKPFIVHAPAEQKLLYAAVADGVLKGVLDAVTGVDRFMDEQVKKAAAEGGESAQQSPSTSSK